MDNIIGQLEDRQIQLVGRARGLGIVSSVGAIPGAEMVDSGTDIQTIKQEDYPAIADHLDIVSYMLYKVGGAKVIVWDVQIRLKGDSGVEGGGARSFKDSKDQRDGFDIYHYTLEISGTMAQIRDALKRLDDCYAVRRVYMVKNIALYAEDNIADSIFTGKKGEEESAEQQKSASSAPESGRRRRRGGSAVVNIPSEDGGEPGSESDNDRKEQEKLDREYELAQSKLPYYERDGWGERIVAAKGADETFRAVIDVEYVVKPDK